MDNLILHHFCYQISSGNLKVVKDLFINFFDFKIGFEPPDKSMVMLYNPKKGVDIQFIQAEYHKIDIDMKVKTHIAFLSNNPDKLISSIEKWADEQNIIFKKGKWADTQCWFDFSEIFLNFVVEIMDYKVISDAKKN